MFRLLSIILLAASVTAAQAIVIDLESFASPSLTYLPSYSEDGFIIVGHQLNTSETFDRFGTTSTTMWCGADNGLVRLIKADRSVFDLNCIDLGVWNGSTASDTPTSVTFTGFYSDGSRVLQSFNLGTDAGFRTFNFDSFSSVVRVEWRQTYGYHQFDNVVLNETSPTPVPDGGATVALLGMALSSVAWLRRKLN